MGVGVSLESLGTSASAWGLSGRRRLDHRREPEGSGSEAQYLGDTPSQPFPIANLGGRGRGGPRVSRGLRR